MKTLRMLTRFRSFPFAGPRAAGCALLLSLALFAATAGATSFDTEAAVRRCRKISRSSTNPMNGDSTKTARNTLMPRFQPHSTCAL